MLLEILGTLIVLQGIIMIAIVKLYTTAEIFFPPFGAKGHNEGPTIGESIDYLERGKPGLYLILHVSRMSTISVQARNAFLTVQKELDATFSLIGFEGSSKLSRRQLLHYIPISQTDRANLNIHSGPFMLVCRDGVVLRKGIVNNLEHVESMLYDL